jgi:hypothetical protein
MTCRSCAKQLGFFSISTHVGSLEQTRTYSTLYLRAPPAVSLTRPPAAVFFHPDGVIRPSRAPTPRFPPDLAFHPSGKLRPSPSPPGCARGLRTRKKWGRARSVGERTHEPYHFVVANPPSPPVARSPSAPPLANLPAG